MVINLYLYATCQDIQTKSTLYLAQKNGDDCRIPSLEVDSENQSHFSLLIKVLFTSLIDVDADWAGISLMGISELENSINIVYGCLLPKSSENYFKAKGLVWCEPTTLNNKDSIDTLNQLQRKLV